MLHPFVKRAQGELGFADFLVVRLLRLPGLLRRGIDRPIQPFAYREASSAGCCPDHGPILSPDIAEMRTCGSHLTSRFGDSDPTTGIRGKRRLPERTVSHGWQCLDAAGNVAAYGKQAVKAGNDRRLEC